MICKCGAVVKASADSAEITGFGVSMEQKGAPAEAYRAIAGEMPWPTAGGGAVSDLAVQELGTIDAGSKEVTAASDDKRRPPPRSNSDRRSKALERRNG
jgi:hypothetical protein